MMQRKHKTNELNEHERLPHFFFLSATQCTMPNGTESARGPFPMPILVRFGKSQGSSAQSAEIPQFTENKKP